MRIGPIIVIDDDNEDVESITEALDVLEVKNRIIALERASDAIAFFETMMETPFLILCDINMPGTNGLELRKKLYRSSTLRAKTVPFLFFTTSGQHPDIKNAYELAIQGFFVKPSSFDELIKVLKKIVDYWRISYIPV